MDQNDIAEKIRVHIARQYELLTKRPDVICSPLNAEAFILALEGIIDLLNSSNERTDSYQAFLAAKHFGMRVFQSKFHVDESATLGFVDPHHNQGKPELYRKYLDSFHDHWVEYLEWKINRA